MAVAQPVVYVLVPVYVPLVRPERPLDVDRERLHVPAVVGDAAGDDAARALVERGRRGVHGLVGVDHARVGSTHLLGPPVRRGDSSTRSSSSMPMWAGKGKPSTVGSGRWVRPSTAPASTQACTMACSSSPVCSRARPVRRASSATMP